MENCMFFGNIDFGFKKKFKYPNLKQIIKESKEGGGVIGTIGGSHSLNTRSASSLENSLRKNNPIP